MASKLCIIILSVFFVMNLSFAQNERAITIGTNSISVPETYDFGDVTKNSREVVQYFINNERSDDVEIINIKTPPGFMASASSNIIEANDEVTLYIVIDSKWVDMVGEFSEKIKIQTNLLQEIIIEVKGNFLE